MRHVLAGLAAAALLAGCSGGGGAGPGPAGTAGTAGTAAPGGALPVPSASGAAPGAAAPGAAHPCGVAAAHRYRHVVWIWFENRSYGQVAGRPALPYLYRLGRACGLATDYHAVRHPSLPNYLAAATGRDPGPIGDCEPAACPQRGATIFSQLGPRGWAAYDESMPAPCDPVTSGSYAARHNPAVYFADIRDACRQDDLSLSELPAVLAAGRLPAFSWITPDICNDMHDCPASAGDRWLAGWLPRILDAPQYRSGSTAVFITWDESSGASSTNQVALFVVAPSVPAGARVGLRAGHFALLHTTEWLLGLPPLGAAAGAPLLSPGFHL